MMAGFRSVRLGPASRVSIGLVSLILGCLLALDLFFGVLPDQSTHLRQLRERTSRDIAAQVATTVASGDLGALHRELQQTVLREKQLLSVGVRRQDGTV